MWNKLKKYFPFLEEEKPSPSFEKLKQTFEKRHDEVKQNVLGKHQEVMSWASKTFSMHQLTAGSMGGLLLLSAPHNVTLPKPQLLLMASEIERPIDQGVFLITDLTKLLPKEMRALTPTEEDQIGTLLSNKFAMVVRAELEGKRLNRSYGYIGAEQHLARFPGDGMSSHFSDEDSSARFGGSGMAPGLGAWGYFAHSRQDMTENDIDKEKYYIAVQTFLSPGYRENVSEYNTFFKHRKMLVVNPENGKAMVVVIGDAGPAEWTGKHLGGSPEVMGYLERVDGAQKGPVLYFFIDDPENKIALGPVVLK